MQKLCWRICRRAVTCASGSRARASRVPALQRPAGARKPLLVCAGLAMALVLLIPAAVPPEGRSDTLRIAQIDNSSLLINQQVRAYISVIGEEGRPVSGLDRGRFRVYESTPGGGWEQRDILWLRQGVNINQGINFLLVVDNSGSMYWDDTGRIRDSEDESLWRITDAKEAVRAFLRDITNPHDRVGLISFNVDIDLRVAPTGDLMEVQRALERIRKPPREESYTELYESLYRSVDDIRGLKGRKVIILLTDGWDFPRPDNPAFPRRAGLDGAIEHARSEGISVFTIGLSEGADARRLTRIARETGGAYFSVYNADRLASLYALIRNQVLGEYLLAYRATMYPAQEKEVRVVYTPGGGEISLEARGSYFAGTIFGYPWERYRYRALLAVPAALLLLLALSLVKLEKRRARPSLQVMTMAGKRGRRTVPLTGAVTIGSAAGSDITIPGGGGPGGGGAPTVTIRREGGQATLVSEGGTVLVNNRDVRRKTLRSGDLIRIGDTTVVFDEGAQDRGAKKHR
ncbi:MAG: VWA domain-containing protein [Spirochaetota bacterium]